MRFDSLPDWRRVMCLLSFAFVQEAEGEAYPELQDSFTQIQGRQSRTESQDCQGEHSDRGTCASGYELAQIRRRVAIQWRRDWESGSPPEESRGWNASRIHGEVSPLQFGIGPSRDRDDRRRPRGVQTHILAACPAR